MGQLIITIAQIEHSFTFSFRFSQLKCWTIYFDCLASHWHQVSHILLYKKKKNKAPNTRLRFVIYRICSSGPLAEALLIFMAFQFVLFTIQANFDFWSSISEVEKLCSSFVLWLLPQKRYARAFNSQQKKHQISTTESLNLIAFINGKFIVDFNSKKYRHRAIVAHTQKKWKLRLNIPL